ncbi:uncharacterized protein LOC128884147 [Hylaeus volcanicus]|uniref:uncharacterized protein LOC128884147 n=1 Tax=Hylaeus volcanicus TaxID=313075 RepID=UPI0023B7E33A|nr:uncharacterized protein LOC128884147 [Hylaeus volcanicus]XP_053993221.1 uncharacterized protein LOC128884147 [Hylaeus volcanicus]
MFNIFEEFQIKVTYVDIQVNVHFISEAVVMDVKKQMSWYFKSVQKNYCAENKTFINLEYNEEIGIQNYTSDLLESLDLAKEQAVKKDKSKCFESWNEIEDNTKERRQIFQCCFSNFVDGMSLNEVYPIRDPTLIDYHNVFFLLQSTTGWILASEVEYLSSTEEEMEHEVITRIVNKQHLEHEWKKHLIERHKTFHISLGSYLETDLWTNFLQKNKSRNFSLSDLAHQCLICVEQLHVTIQLKTGEEEGVLLYKFSVESTPCSGFVGPLKMMGLGWKKNANALKKKKSHSTGFDRLDEMVVMKKFGVLSSGNLTLFPWSRIPSLLTISVTCPVLILICTSERLQQLIHLFDSVVMNSDVCLQRGITKTTQYNQNTKETLLQFQIDGKQTKKTNTSFQLPKYISNLTQRRFRRSFHSYIFKNEATEDKDLSITNDCLPTPTSDVEVQQNYLRTNKKDLMTDDVATTVTLQCLIDQISFSFLHQDKVFSRCSCTNLRVKAYHSLCLYRVTRIYVEVNDILLKCLNSMSKIHEKECMINVLEPMKKDLDQPAFVLSAKSRSIFIPTVKTLCFVKIYDEFMVKLEPLQVHLSPTIIENFYSFFFSSQPSTRKIIDIVNPRFPIPEVATKSPSGNNKKKTQTYKNKLPTTYHKFFLIHPFIVSVTFTGGHLSFENILLNYKPFIRKNKMGTFGKMVQMYLWSLGRQTTGAVISCHFKNLVERYQSKRITHERFEEIDKGKLNSLFNVNKKTSE